jgi:hypothetical protein
MKHSMVYHNKTYKLTQEQYNTVWNAVAYRAPMIDLQFPTGKEKDGEPIKSMDVVTSEMKFLQ